MCVSVLFPKREPWADQRAPRAEMCVPGTRPRPPTGGDGIDIPGLRSQVRYATQGKEKRPKLQRQQRRSAGLGVGGVGGEVVLRAREREREIHRDRERERERDGTKRTYNRQQRSHEWRGNLFLHSAPPWHEEDGTCIVGCVRDPYGIRTGSGDMTRQPRHLAHSLSFSPMAKLHCYTGLGHGLRAVKWHSGSRAGKCRG